MYEVNEDDDEEDEEEQPQNRNYGTTPGGEDEENKDEDEGEMEEEKEKKILKETIEKFPLDLTNEMFLDNKIHPKVPLFKLRVYLLTC